MRITSFGPDHLPAAARLLAARNQRDRVAEPLLPARFSEVETCHSLVERALAGGATGAVAIDGDRVLGYLLSASGEDEDRGRHTWSDPEHHARAEDATPDVTRHLYAHLAPGWIEEGRLDHYAVAPVSDTEPWINLAFAQESVHAVLATAGAAPPPDPRWTLRIAGPADLDAVAPLTSLIADAHIGPPTFARIGPAFYANLRPGTLGLLEDENSAYWIAEDGGEVLGYAAMRPIPPDEDSLLTPAGSVDLIVAATAPAARGTGVGRALFEQALAWAAEHGYEVCLTGWRTANLSSSTFWPRRGFRPTAYRFHRTIDPRFAPN